MVRPRTLSFVFGLAVLAAAACSDKNDVTSAKLSLVQLTVDAPDTAKSGENFGVQVRALNVGLAGIHNGRVTVTLPAPLTVLSVNAASDTSATFSKGAAGATAQWSLGTLDSNSQFKLDITTIGVLAPTDGTKKLTVVATMIADGIKPGDASAQDDVTLVQ